MNIRPPRRAVLATLVFAPALALASAALLAQSGGELERGVKAAYLYKFLGYVEWPPGTFATAADPIVVGVAGDEDVAAELARIVAGRTVDGRTVSVVALRRNEPPAGVHVLYVGRGEGARTNALVTAAQARAVLTVTDIDGGLDRGSIINFVRVGDNIRFEISLEAAERSRLKLSSRLLAVATTVRTGPT